jgi:hypothetical protein
VKKLLAMLVLASVIVTGVIGCTSSPTTKKEEVKKTDK